MLSRTSFVSVALIVFIVGLFTTGCAASTNQTPTPISEPDALVMFAASSDIGLGAARISLSIRKIDGEMINDDAGRFEVTYSPPNSDEIRRVTDLQWRVWPVRGGLYTATMTFDTVGLWQVRIRATDDPSLLPAATGILVKSKTDSPDIGESAPLVGTKTTPPDGNLRSITSAPEPDPALYKISFDDAVATGLPTVISFSTPAYCQSGTCGPQTDVLSQLSDTYRDQANFIHVEIFDNPEEMLAAGDPSLGIESPVIHEWGFNTEPWTYVVDGSGIVVGRFEAFVTLDELKEYIVPLIEGT